MGILDIFIDLLQNSKSAPNINEIQDGLLFNFAFLLGNVKDKIIINYIFGTQKFQAILAFPYHFDDFFVLSRYVGIIKSISLKFHTFPFYMFFNKVKKNWILNLLVWCDTTEWEFWSSR